MNLYLFQDTAVISSGATLAEVQQLLSCYPTDTFGTQSFRGITKCYWGAPRTNGIVPFAINLFFTPESQILSLAEIMLYPPNFDQAQAELERHYGKPSKSILHTNIGSLKKTVWKFADGKIEHAVKDVKGDDVDVIRVYFKKIPKEKKVSS